MTMALFKELLYALSILTSLACTIFLALGYRRRRVRLLMWSALCFACLTINNLLLFVDLVIFPGIDLRLPRVLSALAGMVILLHSFIWDAE